MSQLQNACQELESELTSLKQRSSQIPAEDVRIRQRMAEALGVFRATAIEMEEANLKEIREARARLTEAIETNAYAAISGTKSTASALSDMQKAIQAASS